MKKTKKDQLQDNIRKYLLIEEIDKKNVKNFILSTTTKKKHRAETRAMLALEPHFRGYKSDSSQLILQHGYETTTFDYDLELQRLASTFKKMDSNFAVLKRLPTFRNLNAVLKNLSVNLSIEKLAFENGQQVIPFTLNLTKEMGAIVQNDGISAFAEILSLALKRKMKRKVSLSLVLETIAKKEVGFLQVKNHIKFHVHGLAILNSEELKVFRETLKFANRGDKEKHGFRCNELSTTTEQKKRDQAIPVLGYFLNALSYSCYQSKHFQTMQDIHGGGGIHNLVREFHGVERHLENPNIFYHSKELIKTAKDLWEDFREVFKNTDIQEKPDVPEQPKKIKAKRTPEERAAYIEKHGKFNAYEYHAAIAERKRNFELKTNFRFNTGFLNINYLEIY